ncbi:MAG: D-glycero-beta-D-manno-heptose 1,7-bisphosphate 7-phosphatase [Desulfobacteraceae bacterium]
MGREYQVTLKTVFIDRDGVINRDSPDYIKTRAEFHFLPGSLEAFRLLSEHGYTAIVITNQSVIGRQLTTPGELHLIFEMMKQDIVKAGGFVTDIMFCPHTPSDHCRCRKPEPGMIFDARDKYNLDLTTSVMIGDSAKDILCAENAGVGRTVLVKTGNGLKAHAELSAKGISPDYVAEDLLDAVRWVISNDGIHDRKH